MRPGDLDLAHPDTFRDGHPYEYYRVLRREAPVHWNPAHGQDFGLGPVTRGFYAITRYDDVLYVSKHPHLFSSHAGTIFIVDHEREQLEQLRLMIINQDPPEHNASRSTVNRGFTPRMVERLEVRIRGYARDIVAAVAGRGECEFVRDVAADLPLILICELVGIPQQDRQQIFDWSNKMIGGEDSEMSDRFQQEGAAAESWLYAQRLAAEKRARADDTLISKFVHGSDGEASVTEDRIANFFIILQAAGSETTRNATTHAMMLLQEHPDQLHLLRSDLERYLPSAVEEILRYRPPVIVMRRTATQDTELRGVTIRKGEKVALFYGACNRDEEAFAEPDRFDIAREPNPHLTLGIGQHHCLGANLARMQLRCILREILTQLDEFEILGTPELQRSTLIDGVKRMRVRFTASERGQSHTSHR